MFMEYIYKIPQVQEMLLEFEYQLKLELIFNSLPIHNECS